VHAGVNKWYDKTREAIRDELKMLAKEVVFQEIKKKTQLNKEKML
jgi:hypothetical protein